MFVSLSFTLKWIVCISHLLISTMIVRVKAAHSRRRLVIRRDLEPRYDRSITTFSSDGRLLQVEYGMEASNRGSTVTALAAKEKVCVVVPSSHEVFRIDEHVWLFACGLSGDSRFLASNLRNVCQRFRLSYGEAPTVKEVAKFASRAQHQLTWVAGARPLGCTAILVGISHEQPNQPQLYRTGPGGVMEECSFCTAGKDRNKALKALAEIYEHLDACEGNSNNEVEYKIAQKMIDTMEEMEEAIHVNVWTIQPNINRRGKSQATCYLNINRKSLAELANLDINQYVKS